MVPGGAVHVVFAVVQVVSWYQAVLGFLPVQLLRSPLGTVPSRTSASIYMSDAWRVAMDNFLALHPAPAREHLLRLQNVFPVLENVHVRNQARLLIHRWVHNLHI